MSCLSIQWRGPEYLTVIAKSPFQGLRPPIAHRPPFRPCPGRTGRMITWTVGGGWAGGGAPWYTRGAKNAVIKMCASITIANVVVTRSYLHLDLMYNFRKVLKKNPGFGRAPNIGVVGHWRRTTRRWESQTHKHSPWGPSAPRWFPCRRHPVRQSQTPAPPLPFLLSGNAQALRVREKNRTLGKNPRTQWNLAIIYYVYKLEISRVNFNSPAKHNRRSPGN